MVMNIKRAKEILGDRTTWELRNMRKTLNFCSLLNTAEENLRLKAVNVVLRSRK